MDLKQWRLAAGYSQADVGSLLTPARSQQSVWMWEDGRVRVGIDFGLQLQRLSGNRVTLEALARMYDPEKARRSRSCTVIAFNPRN